MSNMTTCDVCAPTNPTNVLSLRTACEASSLSISTMRRLIRAGRGPRQIQLSERRIGIRRADLDDWLNSRSQK